MPNMKKINIIVIEISQKKRRISKIHYWVDRIILSVVF